MKVGDYVRTDDGLIGKVVSEPYEYKDSIACDIDFGNNDIYNEYEMYQSIVKSSPNIIDLIEEGDYVNGKEILEIKQNAESGLRYLTYSYVPMGYYVERSDEIKSIVTKQQYNSMKYIVGDE